MPYTVHPKKITMWNFASKESQLEVTEKIYVINCWAEFQALLPRQHRYLPWGTASSPNRAIRKCWTTSKLEILYFLYFLFLHLSKNLVYFLSPAETESAYFGWQNSLSPSLNHQLTPGRHKFPNQPPWLINGKEQTPKSVSIAAHSSLCYLPDKHSPTSCWRAWHWRGEPGIDRAVCLHLRTESARPLLQLQGSN